MDSLPSESGYPKSRFLASRSDASSSEPTEREARDLADEETQAKYRAAVSGLSCGGESPWIG